MTETDEAVKSIGTGVGLYRTFLVMAMSGLIGVTGYLGSELKEGQRTIQTQNYDNGKQIAVIQAQFADIQRQFGIMQQQIAGLDERLRKIESQTK